MHFFTDEMPWLQNKKIYPSFSMVFDMPETNKKPEL